MIVRHERSGGFAGITIHAEVNSDDLSAAQSRELKKLVEQAFPLDQPLPKKDTMPDQFDYEFIIEENGKTTTWQVNDETITDNIRALSNWLIATAKKQSR
ncbi:MAG: protealysin inhibitor emfourin [Blastocatellia bacterium]